MIEKVFSMERFYIGGMVCYGVITIASVYGLVLSWDVLNLGYKVSSVFSNIFNGLIFMLFLYLYNQSKPQEVTSFEELQKEITQPKDLNSSMYIGS